MSVRHLFEIDEITNARQRNISTLFFMSIQPILGFLIASHCIYYGLRIDQTFWRIAYSCSTIAVIMVAFAIVCLLCLKQLSSRIAFPEQFILQLSSSSASILSPSSPDNPRDVIANIIADSIAPSPSLSSSSSATSSSIFGTTESKRQTFNYGATAAALPIKKTLYQNIIISPPPTRTRSFASTSTLAPHSLPSFRSSSSTSFERFDGMAATTNVRFKRVEFMSNTLDHGNNQNDDDDGKILEAASSPLISDTHVTMFTKNSDISTPLVSANVITHSTPPTTPHHVVPSSLSDQFSHDSNRYAVFGNMNEANNSGEPSLPLFAKFIHTQKWWRYLWASFFVLANIILVACSLVTTILWLKQQHGNIQEWIITDRVHLVYVGQLILEDICLLFVATLQTIIFLLIREPPMFSV